MLEGMYQRIKAQEFRTGNDHVTQVLKVILECYDIFTINVTLDLSRILKYTVVILQKNLICFVTFLKFY